MQATGSGCAPFPCSNSVSARWDMKIECGPTPGTTLVDRGLGGRLDLRFLPGLHVREKTCLVEVDTFSEQFSRGGIAREEAGQLHSQRIAQRLHGKILAAMRPSKNDLANGATWHIEFGYDLNVQIGNCRGNRVREVIALFDAFETRAQRNYIVGSGLVLYKCLANS